MARGDNAARLSLSVWEAIALYRVFQLAEHTAADLFEQRARLMRAQEMLHSTKNASAALRELGVTRRGWSKGGKRSEAEKARFVALYVRLVEGPRGAALVSLDCRQDLESAIAQGLRAGRVFRGARLQLTEPADLLIPDELIPMSPVAALRNFARFTGLSPRTAWDFLQNESKLRDLALRLPRRPR